MGWGGGGIRNFDVTNLNFLGEGYSIFFCIYLIIAFNIVFFMGINFC